MAVVREIDKGFAGVSDFVAFGEVEFFIVFGAWSFLELGSGFLNHRSWFFLLHSGSCFLGSCFHLLRSWFHLLFIFFNQGFILNFLLMDRFPRHIIWLTLLFMFFNQCFNHLLLLHFTRHLTWLTFRLKRSSRTIRYLSHINP